MRSTTHHRPYTIATDYSTVILTLIFITYCYFIPTYLVTTLIPTADYSTLQTVNHTYILQITPEPFKKYYTLLYNDTQLLILVIIISAILCTTLSPYRQTILRPSLPHIPGHLHLFYHLRPTSTSNSDRHRQHRRTPLPHHPIHRPQNIQRTNKYIHTGIHHD